MMLNPSLRKRLLIILLLASATTWLIAAAVSNIDSKKEIEDIFDAELAQIAKVLLTLSNHELYEELITRGDGHASSPLDIVDLAAHRYEKKLAYQVWFDNDEIALRSIYSPETPLSQQKQGYSISESDGRRWRVFSLSDLESGLTVQVGVLYNSLHGLASQIAMRVLKLIVVALAVTGIFTWLGVGKALRPLYRIADQVAQRNSFDLTPIQEQQVPKETIPLINALNNLLKHLHVAFYNERCFTSNAAHELRTPLAGIAAHNEVALLTDSQEMRVSASQQVKDGILHMTRLMQQLLILARFDFPGKTENHSGFDIKKLAFSLIKEFRQTAIVKYIDLALHFQGHNIMLGNEAAIEVLLRNILDNAIRYTPQRGIVRLEISCLKNQVLLRIKDSGPGITEKEKRQVFQRFYRGHSETESGSGLGLSIVQRCVELHNGEIFLSTSSIGGLQLEVCIPYSSQTSANNMDPISIARPTRQ